jgi:hypothetical protein
MSEVIGGVRCRVVRVAGSFGAAGCAEMLDWSSMVKSARLGRSPGGDQGLQLCGLLHRTWDARDLRTSGSLLYNGLFVFVAVILVWSC